jgi:hypothetical protein
MFKVDLNIFPKFVQVIFKSFVDYLNKQNKFQIDEILDFFTFLVDAEVKCTYALSTSNVKVLIY